MTEHDLRELLDDVKAGRFTRRGFVTAMVGLGLTAPLAAQMLGDAGGATAQPAAFTPTKRGGGGPLKVRMNDLVLQHGVVVPIALRAKGAAMAHRLRGVEVNPYDLDFWNIAFWYRDA